MGNAAGRLPYEFSCPCGERIHIDPMTKERRIPCPRCQKPLDFTVNFDTTRRTILVSAVTPRNLAPAPAGSPPPSVASRSSAPAGKSAGRTVRAVIARCSCGTAFPIDDQRLDDVQSCPGCECGYHVVVKTESAGKKRVAILVPQKPIVHRDEIIRATIYRRAPGSPGKTALDGTSPAPDSKSPGSPPPSEPVVARRSRTRIVVPKSPPPPVAPVRPKPTPEVPPGAQAVPCPCGATFIVRKKDLAPGLTCSQCGLSAVFEEVRDPQTLAPVIHIKSPPRSRK